ncbi:MAG: dihydrolipoamide acetyltransferase family protein [Burkholderiales bacterium]|nr:dihydrolipoamide acetyltransferase family protein [Burkholderiales bacterium]
MAEFRMPALGADMEAGTLVEWHIKPGDTVKRGQVVAVVETQKGAIEVEIWEDGVVERLVVQPGAKVPVGEVLAVLRGEGEASALVAPPAAAPTPTATVPTAAPATIAADRRKVSPSARRLAQELGVDLATVQSQAVDGVISRADIERAAAIVKQTAAAPAAPPEAAAGDWRVQMRKAIAAAMSRSKREIPHYYLATDIDVTSLLIWLTAENAKRSVAERLLPAVPLMKAVALALREVPELNGFWIDGAFRPSTAVHLGMAIAMRGGGLVAPAIHDADHKNCDELMAALRDLIARVRGGRLRSSEMADPTVTLTSLGEQGVAQVFGVIYPPQVAIVGLGRIAERPWVTAGTVAARQVLTASLAADHRVSDGHRGALFLAALDRLLQAPEKLDALP